MATLYELQAQYELIKQLAEAEESDFSQALADVTGELSEKMESYAIVDIELESQELKLDAEIKRLTERKKRVSKNRKNLRGAMTEALLTVDGNKLKTEKFNFGFRGSTAVVIEDISLIPPQYVEEEITKKVDKNVLKKAIKNGAKINGAKLVENISLSIK